MLYHIRLRTIAEPKRILEPEDGTFVTDKSYFWGDSQSWDIHENKVEATLPGGTIIFGRGVYIPPPGTEPGIPCRFVLLA